MGDDLCVGRRAVTLPNMYVYKSIGNVSTRRISLGTHASPRVEGTMQRGGSDEYRGHSSGPAPPVAAHGHAEGGAGLEPAASGLGGSGRAPEPGGGA